MRHLFRLSIIIYVRVFAVTWCCENALVGLAPLLFAYVVAMNQLLVVSSSNFKRLLLWLIWSGGQIRKRSNLHMLLQSHSQAVDLGLSRQHVASRDEVSRGRQFRSILYWTYSHIKNYALSCYWQLGLLFANVVGFVEIGRLISGDETAENKYLRATYLHWAGGNNLESFWLWNVVDGFPGWFLNFKNFNFFHEVEWFVEMDLAFLRH